MSSEEQVPVAEELIDNTDQGRFELHRDGDLAGWLYYTHLKPNRYALLHTEVEPSHQRQGVGGAMVRRVLDEIRAREGTITVICPFVADYLSRTTTHADLIDARHPGYSIVLLPSQRVRRPVTETTRHCSADPSDEHYRGIMTWSRGDLVPPQRDEHKALTL